MKYTEENSIYELYKKYQHNITKDHPFVFWHYTSIDGLMGIVRNKESEKGKLHFWFTRSDCLNDTSEGNYILELYKQVCNDLLCDDTIDKAYYDIIYELDIPNEQFIDFPLPSDEDHSYSSMLDLVPCDSYICSFSLKEDSLDMWRYYSKGKGGYGLKFTYALFNEQQEYDLKSYDPNVEFSCIKAFEVIYDKDKQTELLKELIKDAYYVYIRFPNLSGRLQQFIKNELKEYQYTFKHECFESEQEYRYVFYRPIVKPKDLKNELPVVKFRNQDGMVIPYLDIEISKYAHILEVLISPFVKNETAQLTLTEYIKSCGFKGCKIRTSELPIR